MELSRDTGEPGWWKRAVVYQVYPRSFADSNGDGIGDLGGVLDKVDYLAELGVDVVWLSPIYQSPQADNGYDISDYQSIDPIFGTLEQFDELVDQLHRRGMKLMMDLVVNHTSDEHPWFLESARSVDSPLRDWYIWREGQGENGERSPNNWRSFFSGPVWKRHEATDEYYLHLFAEKQPDLNWENPALRKAVYEMMRWWLDRGVDGFRMDVINLISKASGLPDGPAIPGTPYGDGMPHYASGPRIHEFLAEMRREVFGERADRFISVGEMPGATIEQALLYTDPASGELDMVFQFEHMLVDRAQDRFHPKPLNVRALRDNLAKWQLALAERGWNSLYWNNHDQPRAVSRFGDDGAYRERSAKALGMVLHLMRGTPYIYQGEELAMGNYPFESLEQYRDVEVINYVAEQAAFGHDRDDVLARLRTTSRDNARTPVQWDAGPNAGFSTGEPWIGINPDYLTVNAAEQMGRAGSVFSFYRELVTLRHEVPVIAYGDFELIDSPETVIAYRRTHGAQELIVAVNCSSEPVAWSPQVPAGATLLLCTVDRSLAIEASLEPWEGRVYLREPATTAYSG